MSIGLKMAPQGSKIKRVKLHFFKIVFKIVVTSVPKGVHYPNNSVSALAAGASPPSKILGLGLQRERSIIFRMAAGRN